MTTEYVKNKINILIGAFIAIAAFAAETLIYIYKNYIIELKEPVVNTFIALGQCIMNFAKIFIYFVAICLIVVTCAIKFIFEYSFLLFYYLNNFLKKINKKLKNIFIILKNYLIKSIEFRKEIIEMGNSNEDLIPTVPSYEIELYRKEVV